MEITPIEPMSGVATKDYKTRNVSISSNKKSVAGSINTNVRASTKKVTMSHHRQSMASASDAHYFGISPTKKTCAQKKVKFYPDMAIIAKQDRLLYKFIQKDYGDPFLGKAIDPDDVEFNAPDFGFNNYLVFDEKTEEGMYSPNWKYFMDYQNPFPKFQRLQNYIQFVNEQKYEEDIRKYIGNGKAQRQGSIIGKINRKQNPAEQFETMQRIKAEMVRNKTNADGKTKETVMTKGQLKCIELGEELENIQLMLTKEKGFAKHIMKQNRKEEKDFNEEQQKQPPARRQSLSKLSRYSPDNSPASIKRESQYSRAAVFKGFTKQDMSYNGNGSFNKTQKLSTEGSPNLRKSFQAAKVQKKAVFKEYTQSSRDIIEPQPSAKFLMP